jgi:hypothetical protein
LSLNLMAAAKGMAENPASVDAQTLF